MPETKTATPLDLALFDNLDTPASQALTVMPAGAPPA